ncbi:hypothetical protein [Neisseria bacilliformis]|uniref:hypothetical protein n=1 Tax=Neisseria bacilliformis TaxID=267212 RepID=UPI000A797E71|nr:hypothetical protein [Neisseria bacilliformis]
MAFYLASAVVFANVFRCATPLRFSGSLSDGIKDSLKTYSSKNLITLRKNKPFILMNTRRIISLTTQQHKKKS